MTSDYDCAPAYDAVHAYTALEMDENHWTTGTFNLAVKRTRPETPIEDDRSSTPWEGFAGITDDQVRDFYHDWEPAASAKWTETSRPSEESSRRPKKSGTQMRTGCIPCLYVPAEHVRRLFYSLTSTAG